MRAALVGPALFGWLRPVGVAAQEAPPDAPEPSAGGVTLRLAFTAGQTFKYAFEVHMGVATAGGASQRETTLQAVYAYTVTDVQDDGTALVAAVAERFDVSVTGLPPGFPQPPSRGPDGRIYQALVTPSGVPKTVGTDTTFITGQGNLVNGFPFVGALPDNGYPEAALSQGVPLVLERTLEDPTSGSSVSVQIAPGFERREITLLGVSGTGDAAVAAVSEHITGSSPTRRIGKDQQSDLVDVSAEYEVVLLTGLTRQARTTYRIEVTSASPSPAAPQVFVATGTTEYHLVDAAV